MRLALVAAFLLMAGVAQAQAPLTGTTAPLGSPAAPNAVASSTPAAPVHRRGMTLQERFDAANVTHDGHLTLEQARSKMPSVARDFAAIDTTHLGYVTIDQIRAHAQSVRAERRAARKAAAAKP